MGNYYTIGLVIIGAVLLLTMGGFVFSEKFRKDVTASEGEASFFGMLSVKGVIIVLLIGIFVAAMVLIIKYGTPSETGLQNCENCTPAIEINDLNAKVCFNNKICIEAKPLLRVFHTGNITWVKRKYEIENSKLYYQIDTVRFIQLEQGNSYEFSVRFGEENENGDVLWQKEPKLFYKTPNAEITDVARFMDIGDLSWKRKYKVLMTLGQPDMNLEKVEKMHIILSVADVKLENAK